MCILGCCSHETHSWVPSAQEYIGGCFSVYCAEHIFKRLFQAKTSSTLKHVFALRLGVFFCVISYFILYIFYLRLCVCLILPCVFWAQCKIDQHITTIFCLECSWLIEKTSHRGKTIYTNVSFSAPSCNTEHTVLRNRKDINMDCLVTYLFLIFFYKTVKIDSLVLFYNITFNYIQCISASL